MVARLTGAVPRTESAQFPTTREIAPLSRFQNSSSNSCFNWITDLFWKVISWFQNIFCCKKTKTIEATESKEQSSKVQDTANKAIKQKLPEKPKGEPQGSKATPAPITTTPPQSKRDISPRSFSTNIQQEGSVDGVSGAARNTTLNLDALKNKAPPQGLKATPASITTTPPKSKRDFIPGNNILLEDHTSIDGVIGAARNATVNLDALKSKTTPQDAQASVAAAKQEAIALRHKAISSSFLYAVYLRRMVEYLETKKDNLMATRKEIISSEKWTFSYLDDPVKFVYHPTDFHKIASEEFRLSEEIYRVTDLLCKDIAQQLQFFNQHLSQTQGEKQSCIKAAKIFYCDAIADAMDSIKVALVRGQKLMAFDVQDLKKAKKLLETNCFELNRLKVFD